MNGTRTFVWARIHLYIYAEITTEIKKEDTKFTKAISVEKRVPITMWCLATGSDYWTIGHLFGVAKRTVYVIVHNMCEAIKLKLMPKIHQVAKTWTLESNCGKLC